MKKLLSFILALCILISVVPVLSTSTFAYDEELQHGGMGYESAVIYDEDGNAIEIGGRLTIDADLKKVSRATLPSSYDARSEGLITPVKNQGASSNCWAFAATSVLETNSIINGYSQLESTDFSESHLAWFAVNTKSSDPNDPNCGEGITGDTYNTGGHHYMVKSALSRWAGIADGSKVTSDYTTTQIPKLPTYTDAERFDTSSGLVVKSIEWCDTMSEAKQWIIDNGSIGASYYHVDSSDYLFFGNDYVAYCYTGNDDPETNHAITVVGWDDNFSADKFNSNGKPEGNGAWLCKNSWGSTWGNGGGYFWISYYDKTVSNFCGYITQPADKYDNNYTYNADWYFRTMSSVSVRKIANVFTTKCKEKLNAISTLTVDNDVNVNVEIYKNISANDPTDGELLQSFDVTLTRRGYHTIELPEAILLDPGCSFSVVLRMWIRTGNVNIPIESGSDCTSTEGQSFVYTYKGIWCTTESYSSSYKNIFIQAFTEIACDHLNTETVTKVYDDCYNQGYERIVCKDCDSILSEILLPLKDHAPGEWNTISEASCTQNGLQVKDCTVCGSRLETQSIPMTDHIPGDWIVERTQECAIKGYKVKKCSVCSLIVETEYIPATGHTLGEWEVVLEPNCLRDGTLARKCTVCNKMAETQSIPMLDHEYRYSVIKNPSCSEKGIGKYTCLMCRDSYQVNIEPTGEHTYSEWELVKSPTATEDGEKIHTCINCSEAENKVIKATGFDLKSGVTVDYLTGVISGIKAGEVSLEPYFEIVDEKYSWEYENQGRLGTGTKAYLKNGEEVIGEYTVFLYGDVNGDGWYDGEDAVIVNCLMSNMLDVNSLGEVCYSAADCNHNGIVDANDVRLLMNAGVLLASVDQTQPAEVLLETSSAYTEYLSVIDQSPETENQESADENAVQETVDEPEGTDVEYNFFDVILGFIKELLNILFARV